jgi:hypothetical protein
VDISDIKLIRTDTTLDLSQKAEKVCSKAGWEAYRGPNAAQAAACGQKVRKLQDPPISAFQGKYN